METFISDLSGKEYPASEKISGTSVRLSIMKLIRQSVPDFDSSKSLSISELSMYREKYIADYLSREMGELTELDNTVLDTINENSLISEKVNTDKHDNLTVGQMVADKVATFGGSWTFIIFFGLFILLWICLNIFWFMNRGYDPYPFILLNLILSCLAAVQAPVIMMSQNRQEEKDRERSEDDYMINLKSELELRVLHEKIDHLLLYQQQEVIEIQKIQIEMLTDIQKQIKGNNKENQ